MKNPGTDETADLGELSKTGGIINAFEAIKLASTIKGERKPQKPTSKIKTTVKQ